MRIGRAAQAVGVSPELLRTMERRGELPAPARDRNGQRSYTQEDVVEIRRRLFVRRPQREMPR